MDLPPIVSPQEWDAARQELLVKEKELTRARDALAAQRRRMPRMAVEKDYLFDGPGRSGRPARSVRWQAPAHRLPLLLPARCRRLARQGLPGCSLMADQVGHLAHLNARDTTLVFVSRAAQDAIARLKKRMGWDIPWYSITDTFDADFGVDEWHGTNAFLRDGLRTDLPHVLHRQPRRRRDGHTWAYLDITALGRQEEWEDSPDGYPQTPPYQWWHRHDEYPDRAKATLDGRRWLASYRVAQNGRVTSARAPPPPAGPAAAPMAAETAATPRPGRQP